MRRSRALMTASPGVFTVYIPNGNDPRPCEAKMRHSGHLWRDVSSTTAESSQWRYCTGASRMVTIGEPTLAGEF